MVDNDEIRRRRVERLALLQRTQAGGTPPAESPARAADKRSELNRGSEAAKEAPRETSKEARTEAHTDVHNKKETGGNGGIKQVLPKSTVAASASTPSASTPIPKRSGSKASQHPTVSYVFELPKSRNIHDWPEAVRRGVDSILWDSMTRDDRDPLVYLIGCFNRSEKLRPTLPKVADEIQDAAVTLAFISASAATDDEVHGELGHALLKASLDGFLDKAFIEKLFVTATDDEGALVSLVNDVTKYITDNLEFGSPSTSGAYFVLESMAEVPNVPEVMLALPQTESHSPAQVSSDTFLGRLLDKGVSPDGLMNMHSPDVILNATLNELVEMAKSAEPIIDLQSTFHFRLIEKFIRHGPSSRRLVLQWFGLVLDVNHTQLAMNRISGRTNSLQLMLNVFKILLRLANPFIKLDSSSLMPQLAKINSAYFANAVSYDVSDETKVLAAQDAPFNAQDNQDSLNFVTECFFLCAGFLHFGFHAATQALDTFFKRQVEVLENQIDSLSTNPQMQSMSPALQRLTMSRFQGVLQMVKCEYAGLHVEIHHADLLERAMRFSVFSLTYDVYAAEQCPNNGIQIRVPWDKEPSEAYSSFPEFLVEAPLAAASFVLKSVEFLRNPSMSTDNELLINAAIFFMSSPNVLRNPYLRSKFVEIVYFGGADISLTSGSTVPGALSALFTTSDTCRKFLLPALMSVFIDIEHTGRTSQFYEKFTTRELVANVLKVLWRDPHYRSQLVTESEEKPDFFVRFVALLLNDATFLLDEALGKLLEVHKLQQEFNSPVSGNTSRSGSENAGADSPVSSSSTSESRNESETVNGESEEDEEVEEEDDDDPETSSDPETRLRAVEHSAKNFLQLSSSTMNLLNMFTSTVPHIFATSEIIDRFAVMLNYNLAALVGPRCNQLKVQNPAELGFNPRQLLADLVKVYLNLRSEVPFAKSLSKDERSYSDKNFRKALRLLSKYSLLSPVQLENFESLADRVQEAWKETQKEEEEFGDDIPDEYLDPLMYDLMSNPVTLPTSKVNIDLSTIKTHLLSDPTDPFNRVPLKIEDVIPNVELKREIEEFKKRKKEEGRSKNNAENESKMDVC